MSSNYEKFEHYCRWCQKSYYAQKPVVRDGFCSSRCKQAHYRAYKKWVTARSIEHIRPRIRRRKVK